MLTKSQLYKETIRSPRRPLITVVTCCAVFIAGGHWRETATSSRTTLGPDASVRLARPQLLRTTISSDDHPHSSLNAKLRSGAVHQRRRLSKEAKWRTKQDHMCPPGINLCIQHKQARDGAAADVAAQQKDLRAEDVAATREQQQQERLAAEESAHARQARGGDSDHALMAAAQTSTFQNFMLRQHTPESRRDILKRRAAAKRQHRAKALEYLRERLVEESQWEKAQVAGAFLSWQYSLQHALSSCA